MSDRMKRSFDININTNVDTQPIKSAEKELNGFFEKYENKSLELGIDKKSLKIDTKDFYKAIAAAQQLENSIDGVRRNAPAMIKALNADIEFADNVKGELEQVMAVFNDGSIARGINEITSKLSDGFSMVAVDLGERVNYLKNQAADILQEIKSIGTMDFDYNGKLDFKTGDLDVSQLQKRIKLVEELITTQKELQSFSTTKMSADDFASGYDADGLERVVRALQRTANEMEQFNLKTTEQLKRRKELINEAYSTDWDISDQSRAKENIDDTELYEWYLEELHSFIDKKQNLIREFQANEGELFSVDGVTSYTEDLTKQIQQYEKYIKELQDLKNPIETQSFIGDTSEIVNALKEIKEIISEIKNAFEPLTTALNTEGTAFSNMAKEGATSLDTLADKLKELGSLMDALNKKNFNVVNNISSKAGSLDEIDQIKNLRSAAKEGYRQVESLYNEILATRGKIQGTSWGFSEFFKLQETMSDFDLTDLKKRSNGRTAVPLGVLIDDLNYWKDILLKFNELQNKVQAGSFDSSRYKSFDVKKQLSDAENDLSTSLKNTEIDENTKDALTEIKTANGQIEKELKSIRQQIESTFDLSTVDMKRDAFSAILDSIYRQFVELQTKIKALDFSIDTPAVLVKSTQDETKKVDTGAERSSEVVNTEAQAMSAVKIEATKAAVAKDKFASANKEVKSSAETSVSALKEEADAAEDVAVSVQKAANKLEVSQDEIVKKYKEIYGGRDKVKSTLASQFNKILEDANVDASSITASFAEKTETIGKGADKQVVTYDTIKLIAQYTDEAGKANTITREYEVSTGALINKMGKFKEVKDAFDLSTTKNTASSQLAELEKRMGSFKIDISGVKEALGNITDEASFKVFQNELDSANQKLKEIKASLKSSRSLDPIVNAESMMSNLETIVATYQENIKKLTDVEGFDKLDSSLTTITRKLEEFKVAQTSGNGEKMASIVAEINKEITAYNANLKLVTARYQENTRAANEAAKAEKQRISAANAAAKIQSSQNKLELNVDRQFALLSKQQAQWEKNGQLTDEVRQKINAMLDSLTQVTNASELAAWKTQWAIVKDEVTETKYQIEALSKAQKEASAAINAERKASSEHWNSAFKESVENLGPKKNTELEQLNQYYKEQEKINKQNQNYGKSRYNQEVRNYEKIMANVRAIDSELGLSDGFEKKIEKYKKLYKELGDLRKKFENDPDAINDDVLTKQFQDVALQAEKARKEVHGIVTQTEKLSNLPEDSILGQNTWNTSKFAKAQDAMKAFANEVSNGTFEFDKFNQTGTEMYGTLINSSGAVEKITVALREANGEMVAFSTGTKKVSSGWDLVKSDIIKGATQFASMYLGFNDIIRYLSQGVNSVREIDAAMTELKKVTDETEATYAKFLQTASKSAGAIGSTVKDFTTVASDFARLGYSIEEASDLAKTALVYENVGDGFSSVEEASESIISTMMAFGIEAENTMGIVDRFNAVGNNFAITSKGIGDALQRSASALVEGGNTIDEAIGLVTGANSVIQNPEQVGTALKTLSLRIRSTKVELEEMGEDAEGAATSTAKLRANLLGLTGGKVDIMQDETTFKNTTQILREIAEVWDQMDDISRAGALELIGGKRQANILSSLITNFQTVEDAIETSTNSAGSALAENQKYIESIQGHIDVLTNSVQTMWNNTLNSEAIKFFVDVANAIVQVIDKVGLLQVAIGAIIGILSFKHSKDGLGIFKIIPKFNLLSKMLPSVQSGITSLVGKFGLGAKAATLFGSALSGLTTVGIALLITGLVKLADHLIVTKKELNENAQEVLNTYSAAKEELSSMKSTISEISGEYEKLSQGVDSFGNNINLSTSEYERYNEIVNEIADMFPEMVTGYTEEGNAILACKGNVEELTAAYEAAAQAARQEAIAGSDDVFGAFKKNYDKQAWNIWGDTGLKQQVDLANELVDLINKGDKEELRQYFANGNQLDKNNMLEAAGIDKDDFYGIFSGVDVDALKKKMPKLLSFINSTTSEVNAETAKVTSILDAYLGDNDTYKNLSAESKNVVHQLVDNLSAEFINSDQFESMDDLWAWVETNIVGIFNDPALYDKVGKSIGGLFDLQSQFKNDKISIDEYKTTFLGFVDEINSADIDPQLKEQIEQLFDIDFDDPDSIGKDIDAMVNHVEKLFGDNLTDKIKSKISTLNYSDLVTIDGISIDDGTLKSWDELLKKIETQKVIDFTVDIDVEKTGLESLSTAISESSSAMGMSSEAIANLKSRYQDLESYDPNRLFEETANGIRVNAQALDELEQEYKKQNVDGLNDKLESLTGEYNNLTTEIQNCSDASERSKLYAQRQGILDQINDTATLAAQYTGLTSAYNEWQAAQSGSTERDMYEGILSGKKEVDDEISRGWIDEGSREYIELLSGEDLSAAPFEKVLEVYKKLNKEISGTKYNVYDFFTQDDDGNSTVDGIYNFFNAVMAVQEEGKEWVTKNEDGSFSFDFSVNGGDEAVAEALGISEELVQIILRAAADAGFEINLESAYTELANLKDEAVEANDKLKEIGATDYTFNVNSTNLDDLNEQISEAEEALNKFKNKDGTINIKADGAEEAQMLLATLIYQKQTLDDSAVLKVNTENADAGIETIVKKMQDFKAAYNEFEVKTAIGADTTESKKNVDEAIASLNKEDKKIFADLDVDLTKTPEEINTAINAITVDDLTVKCKLNTDLIDGYVEEEKTTDGTVVWNNNIEAVTDWMAKSHETDGTVNWDNNTDKVKTYFTATGTINWTGDGVQVNGTAHSGGNAFARGNWGAPKSEIALVGELGPEMVVRGNRWFTVGENGAEFTNIKKGDIIFNHKQTEDLLSKGYVTGRGKAYASGTAYAFARESGLGVARYSNAHNNYNVAKKEQIAARTVVVTTDSTEVTSQKADYKDAKKEHINTKKYGSNGSGPSLDASKELQKTARNANGLTGTSSGSGSGTDKDDSEQVIDFIEIKLEEIEASISKTTAKLANYVDDTSKTSQKNALYDNLVKQEQLKEETYSKAADIYTQKANELLKDIPKKYRDMAKNGALAIEDFVGENETEHAAAIQEYRDWNAKADEAEAAELEAIAQQAAYRVEQLNDIADDYQNIVDFIGSESDLIQKQMDLVEESGGRLSATYYEELIKNSKEQQGKLKQEKQQLEKILNESVASGDVKVGSDEWYEMVDVINTVDEEIVQCDIDIEGFQNSINDLKWDNLDKLINRFDALDSELSHLYDRFTDNDNVVDEDGNWTDEGIAAMGVAAQQMDLAKVKSQQYKEAIDDLNKNWKKWGYSPDEYNEKLAELTENQWESIEAYEDAKDKIVDLNKTRIEAVKDGIEKEIDAYQELINKKKEALDAEKDLDGFKKDVAKQEKVIADLERKIAVRSSDTSASAIAERKQLEAELREAQAELDEMYYDRSIENQKDALDQEAENFKDSKNKEMETLDESLKNEENIILESLTAVKNDTGAVLSSIQGIANQYGVNISKEIQQPWLDGKNAVNDFDLNFQTFTTSFNQQLQAIIDQEAALEAQAIATAQALLSSLSGAGSEQKGNSSDGGKSSGSTGSSGSGSSSGGVDADSGKSGGSTGEQKYVEYEVKKGDTLWDIAKDKTGSGTNYKDIAKENGIKDPNKIYVGQKIKVPAYAKGTLETKSNEFAWIDEIGEELVLHAGANGKLSYLTKGSSVVPADLTEKLIDLVIDPTQTLENSRPIVNAPNIVNNEINIDASIAEVIHIDTVTNDAMPNLEKVIEKQMDKYVKGLNAQIRKYTR